MRISDQQQSRRACTIHLNTVVQVSVKTATAEIVSSVALLALICLILQVKGNGGGGTTATTQSTTISSLESTGNGFC